VKRSEPQDRRNKKRRAREAGDSRFAERITEFWGYRALRALGYFWFLNLGFRFAPPQALCFHPLRGLGQLDPHGLVQRFRNYLRETGERKS